MLKLIAIKVREDYEDYNPSQSSNGGSYYQPTFDVEFLSGLRVSINDTSCGDFGSRIEAALYLGNERLASASFGSMYDWQSEYSDFTEANTLHVALIACVEHLLNYRIPTKEELDKEQPEWVWEEEDL